MYIIIAILAIWAFFRYFGPVFVKYKLTSPTAVAPTRAYGRAACWDVYASEKVVIPVGGWKEVPLDIAFAPAPHFYIKWLNLTFTPFGNVAYKVHARSSLGFKKGLHNHLGIIDNDYRNSISALYFNHNKFPVQLKVGDRVAQIEFFKVPHTFLFKAKKLSNSERGERGFGSSGV